MGRRRRKRIKRVRKVVKPSVYFQCPRCGSLTLTVDFRKAERRGFRQARVTCGSCGLYCEMEVPVLADRVDVYNQVADLEYDGRLDESCKRLEGFEEEGVELPAGEEGQA